jgi:leucyl-tRNA synthetase
LAYQDSRMQWWCDIDKTVLSNEQVIDGKCWRHDNPDDPLVEQKEVKQWFFKITEYADELLDAIDDLDWTESVKLAQKNWIGRSTGAEITFAVEDSSEKITVFTTRADTLFGATFIVVAPELDNVARLTKPDQKPAVETYIADTQKKSELERQTSKQKTGAFTGSYAINPVNGAKLPIWIADYVLAGYGTGAIMAVPAHDERDNEFAKQFDLPITYVVEPVTGESKSDEAVKDAIVAIVRNPKTGEVLMLDWGPRQARHGGHLFVGGGVDEGEDEITCAKREIAEETGYSNVSFVSSVPYRVHSHYFADVKDKNYYAKMRGLLFDLVDDSQVETQLDDGEINKFKTKWVSQTEAAGLVDDDGHRIIFDALLGDGSFHGSGLMVNSGQYDGLQNAEVLNTIVDDLARKGSATKKTNYKMRDWSVSRQRYWGAPIPIIDCPKCGPQLIKDDQLPVILPELDDFQPSGDGRSALARATDWLNVDCPKCGGPAERETDTLDTYICSSWYMLRYLDPRNQQKIFNSDIANKWMPIDFYNGADHATAHLLYARFVTRFFTKIGLITNPEPFKQMLFNGKVTASDGSAFSKSKGNGIDPLEIINSGYGADALRTYLMFSAPLELGARWDPQGVPGTHRFLSRIWNLVQEYNELDTVELSDEQTRAIQRTVHAMIKKVTEDIESSHYNTAIAAAMTCVNDLYKLKTVAFGKTDVWHQALADLVACVAPFAPHISEELWHQLGHSLTVHKDSWPAYDDKYLTSDELTIVVQINGKLRAQLQVSAATSEAEIIEIAQQDVRVKPHLADKTIRKTIYVSEKLVNFVVS